MGAEDLKMPRSMAAGSGAFWGWPQAAQDACQCSQPLLGAQSPTGRLHRLEMGLEVQQETLAVVPPV